VADAYASLYSWDLLISKEFEMAYEWAWGAQPDEWVDDDWIDEYGNYHDISELGGLREQPKTVEDDEEIPF
jgi:hypothetical protein